MRIRKKWIGIVCLIPLVSALLLSVLFYVPAFQDFSVRTISRYVATTTGVQVEIGKVRLAFPFRLDIRDVTVFHESDTLLALKSFKLHLHPLSLLKKRVELKAFDVQEIKVKRAHMIDGIEFRGTLGNLSVRADQIDFEKEEVRLTRFDFSDTEIDIFLYDSIALDETETTVKWNLFFREMRAERVGLRVHMSEDSSLFSCGIGKALVTDALADLGANTFRANRFRTESSSIAYDGNNDEPFAGFDPFHIRLDTLRMELDSVVYSEREIKAFLQTCSGVERSGLQISSLIGRIGSDGMGIHFSGLKLRTPYSEADFVASIPWITIDDSPSGTMDARLKAVIGKEDVLTLSGPLPADFRKDYPERSITLSGRVEGNLADIRLREVKGELPGAFSLDLSGEMKAATDNIRRSGKLRLTANSDSIDFLLNMLSPEERGRYHFPPLRFSGELALKNQEYRTAFQIEEDSAKVRMNARYHPLRRSYELNLVVDSLRPVHFMPQDSLYFLAAAFKAEGRGTDPFRASTWSKVSGKFYDIHYGSAAVSDVKMEGKLEKNLLNFDLISHYPLARMEISCNAQFHRKKEIDAMLIADVAHLDLYGMHLLSDSLSTSFQLFAEAKTDLRINNRLDVTLGNWELETRSGKYNPKTLTLYARSDRDTSRVSFHAGDLGIILTGNADIETMGKQFARINTSLYQQMKRDSVVDFTSLRPLLPDMSLQIKAATDNPVYSFLQQYDLAFERFSLDAYTSPAKGFVLDAGLFNLMQDTTRVDSIGFAARQDSLGIVYEGWIRKSRFRKQEPFFAGLQGKIRNTYVDAEFRYLDGNGETGFLLGARADKEKEGFRIRLFPENPILAFQSFQLNKRNYIFYKNKKEIEADVYLAGENHASLWIYSEATDTEMPILHAELSQINLESISDGFPNLPAMRGMFSTDLQYAPSESSYMLVAGSHIDSLFYNGGRVGELMFNAVYLPIAEKEHQVDMHFFRDREEIGALTAFYREGRTDFIDGSLSVTDFPLEMLTPFVPDQMAAFEGKMQGEMTITGNSSNPKMNGSVSLDDASVHVSSIGSRFKLDSKSVDVVNNRMIFKKYAIWGSGTNPFIIDGVVDFKDPSKMTANMKLRADNMQLIDAEQSKESLLYGKLLVNLNSTLRGPLESLVMRGNLDILGGTNLTYVMQDSPLTVKDRMSGLVSFVDFSDTLLLRRKKRDIPLPIGGMDALITIRIDQSVRLNVDITPDQKSRINLEGGGDLSFQYTPQREMFVNGRYILSGGAVQYAMPVIPLKEFKIQNGSYLEWTGNPMDPVLNLTATERIRAAVSREGGASRYVAFNVGVAIKDRLERLQMQFILSAPEDPAMQQDLNKMDDGQRSQIAVTMLISGMYLNISDAGKGKQANLNMGAALNSFLQNEINHIAGSALKSVDIFLGMEQYDLNGELGGGRRTDFSFRFAKRFYNDRINIILGGRLSSDRTTNRGQAQPFIDNVSVEYRLDATGTRYIKLFYDKNFESLLEGEITEAGVGVVLRRKILRLYELFTFKRNRMRPIPEEQQEKEEEKE